MTSNIVQLTCSGHNGFDRHQLFEACFQTKLPVLILSPGGGATGMDCLGCKKPKLCGSGKPGLHWWFWSAALELRTAPCPIGTVMATAMTSVLPLMVTLNVIDGAS